MQKVVQVQGTTCVLDYYARLAAGASNFPGSSLHVCHDLTTPRYKCEQKLVFATGSNLQSMQDIIQPS